MPTTMLELPRELCLECCSYLEPLDLSNLSRVSRDHYVAVQEPLYSHIAITAFLQLVNLVRAVGKSPVISNISAKQRLHWHKLTDAQLRERDIRSLSITLHSTQKHGKISGEHFSRCIGAISRRGNDTKITLALYGDWKDLISQLQDSSLPDVRKLELCLRDTPKGLWDRCFGGSTFPDLREVDIDTAHAIPSDRDDTIREAGKSHSDDSLAGFLLDGRDYMPFHGLRRMTSIKLRDMESLDSIVLQSLFGSNVIPQHLTRLEISFCPLLNQTESLEALGLLLERGLQMLQYLKLHLLDVHAYKTAIAETRYCRVINEKPEQHLCNIVRELGQNIKSLDLALPYACSRMFLPLPKKPRPADLQFPHIPREPVSTLPERLITAGYKYRRLIVWNGICRDTHDWEDLKAMADDQGQDISWEIVSQGQRCASWHVSSCLPVNFKSRDVLKRQLEEWEK